MRRPLTWITALGLAGLLIGCEAKRPERGGGPVGQRPEGGGQGMGGNMGGRGPQVNYTGEYADGMRAFDANCARCHAINGERRGGGRMGGFPGGMGMRGGPPMGEQGGRPGGFGDGSDQARGGQGGEAGFRGGAGGPPGGGPGGPGGFMGGRGGPQAPDLGKEMKGSKHDAAWIKKIVREGKSDKPNARMPAFDTKRLSDQQLDDIVKYLLSLK